MSQIFADPTCLPKPSHTFHAPQYRTISQPAGIIKAPTRRKAATTSAGRCHWLISVDTPEAIANVPPTKPAIGRHRGEAIRNTAAAADAASVVCPDGSEFSSSVTTPLSGRVGRTSFRTCVATFAPMHAATAIPAAVHRRRITVTNRTTTAATTSEMVGSQSRNWVAALPAGPWMSTASTSADSSMNWPVVVWTK